MRAGDAAGPCAAMGSPMLCQPQPHVAEARGGLPGLPLTPLLTRELCPSSKRSPGSDWARANATCWKRLPCDSTFPSSTAGCLPLLQTPAQAAPSPQPCTSPTPGCVLGPVPCCSRPSAPRGPQPCPDWSMQHKVATLILAKHVVTCIRFCNGTCLKFNRKKD